MPCEKLEVMFAGHDRRAPELWRKTVDILVARNELEDGYSAGPSDRSRSVEQVATYMSRLRKPEFDVAGKRYSIGCTPSSYGREKVTFEVRSRRPMSWTDWDQWSQLFLDDPSLISAVVADVEYRYWEAQSFSSIYDRAGKSYANRILKPAQPDAREQRIDVTRNPGRRIARDGYIETVGALMWLGPQFEARTGADLAAVKAAGWLKISEAAPGVVRIEALDCCFTSAEGVEAELQNRLLTLLFPQVWPLG